ncbi:hypothetical protein Tco_0309434 [Tanacetum coccineum]
MDEFIAHVSEKTYAYGAIRAENQNLLDTISELTARIKNGENGKSVNTNVKRPKSRDSHVKTSVLDVSKNEAKKEAIDVRKNKQTDNTFANVVSNKENVIDVPIANASKAKTLLCISCMQSVLIPCHDKCVAKHKLNVHSNARRTFSVVQIVLWVVDSGCSKHMTGDRSLLRNFVEKFMGTVCFRNDNFAGLGTQIFSVGHFVLEIWK